MEWLFELLAPIVIVPLVLTLAFEQMRLARQQDVLDAGLAAVRGGPSARPPFLSRIPKDVYSILAIIVFVVIILFAIRLFLLRAFPGTPRPGPAPGLGALPNPGPPP